MKQWFLDIGQQAEQNSHPCDCFRLLPEEKFQAAVKKWDPRQSPTVFLSWGDN